LRPRKSTKTTASSSASASKGKCKDCEPGSKRLAPHPGPRCATHHREARKRATAGSHDGYVVKTYGLLPGEYAAQLAYQQNKCAICAKPLTSTARRYAVDHDHKIEKELGTRPSVRGLLCKRHNNLLRDVRDSVETLQAAIDYLQDPPFPRRLREENV